MIFSPLSRGFRLPPVITGDESKRRDVACHRETEQDLREKDPGVAEGRETAAVINSPRVRGTARGRGGNRAPGVSRIEVGNAAGASRRTKPDSVFLLSF